MAGITTTAKERQDMALKGYSKPRFLPGAEGPARGTYHNPTTGQEFHGLPVDPYSIGNYFGRGLVMGRASESLRKLWAETPRRRPEFEEEDGPEYYDDAPPVNSRRQGQESSISPDALGLILEQLKTMGREIHMLKVKLGEAVEDPIEPVQLEFAL